MWRHDKSFEGVCLALTSSCAHCGSGREVQSRSWWPTPDWRNPGNLWMISWPMIPLWGFINKKWLWDALRRNTFKDLPERDHKGSQSLLGLRGAKESARAAHGVPKQIWRQHPGVPNGAQCRPRGSYSSPWHPKGGSKETLYTKPTDQLHQPPLCYANKPISNRMLIQAHRYISIIYTYYIYIYTYICIYIYIYVCI